MGCKIPTLNLHIIKESLSLYLFLSLVDKSLVTSSSLFKMLKTVTKMANELCSTGCPRYILEILQDGCAQIVDIYKSID